MKKDEKDGKKGLIAERRKLEELARATCELRAFMADHEEVFRRYGELEEEERKLTEEFKEMARLRSVPGETVTLYDDEVAVVTVTGPLGAVTYDTVKAVESWPQAAVEAILTVDQKKARAVVEAGIVPGDLAEAAELPRAVLAPGVKVIVRSAEP